MFINICQLCIFWYDCEFVYVYVCNQFFFQISILVDLFVFQIPLLRYKSIFFPILLTYSIHIYIYISFFHKIICWFGSWKKERQKIIWRMRLLYILKTKSKSLLCHMGNKDKLSGKISLSCTFFSFVRFVLHLKKHVHPHIIDIKLRMKMIFSIVLSHVRSFSLL